MKVDDLFTPGVLAILSAFGTAAYALGKRLVDRHIRLIDELREVVRVLPGALDKLGNELQAARKDRESDRLKIQDLEKTISDRRLSDLGDAVRDLTAITAEKTLNSNDPDDDLEDAREYEYRKTVPATESQMGARRGVQKAPPPRLPRGPERP